MSDTERLAGLRSNLELRSRVIRAVRSYFDAEGFLEVQTPILTRSPAPEAHIDAVATADHGFLVTSPELYMKRLLASGLERIYQITPVFRAGELGRLHHPEFTMLEWYRLGSDYEQLQSDTQALLRSVCDAVGRVTAFPYAGRKLSVSEPWERLTVREAFSRYAGWEPGPEPDQDRFDLDLVEKIEPHLGCLSPTFLCEYPADQAALARLKPGDPSVAERFELYWAGIELANGFSELTDPAEQRERFERTLEGRRQDGRPIYPMPEVFLESLARLPACAGIALGIDRLVLILAGEDRLDRVVAFPPDSEEPSPQAAGNN
ncbi:MAG: EF-P lysine aminoacylase GenX [Syntrophobacteraceae bacterium]